MTLEQIWGDYQSSLRAFLRANVANQADVDDLLQEVLLKTHQKLPSLKEASKLKPWLFQIANNSIVDFYRRRESQRALGQQVPWYNEDQPRVLQNLQHCVEPFLNALPPEQAQLLRAVELEGQSQKDYAEQHQLNYSTLKSRIQKSRQQLAEVFTACCSLQLDAQGNVMELQPRDSACNKC